mmetsp:Transcript_34995/g.44196  ORF Transcript_34995/g.44196 Transcript_34995/m.44196 type:complete len:90 (+) Transcript_34995:998-1267(+)
MYIFLLHFDNSVAGGRPLLDILGYFLCHSPRCCNARAVQLIAIRNIARFETNKAISFSKSDQTDDNTLHDIAHWKMEKLEILSAPNYLC